jgi:hypothetical protein
VAKPNYSFEKRQREMAKKKKKEEKASRKANPGPDAAPDEQRPGDGADAPAPPGVASDPA